MELTGKRALKPMQSVVSRTPQIVVTPKTQQMISRRRFNIALGVPAIHLQKPQATAYAHLSMPRIRPSWRLFSFLLALLFGVAIYFALTLPYFHVPNITLLGGGHFEPRRDRSGARCKRPIHFYGAAG